MNMEQRKQLNESEEYDKRVSGDKLREIIEIADKLNWIIPPNVTGYPLMQLSEVEKCMLAMIDDKELQRLRDWAK